MSNALFFFSVVALMMVGSLALVLVAFLRGRKDGNAGAAKRANIAAARERTEELRARIAAGTVTAAQAEEYEAEIASQLLGEAGTREEVHQDPRVRPDWIGVLVVTVFILVVAPIFYATVGSPEMILPAELRGEVTHQNPRGDEAELRQRVAEDPGDAEALVWLAELKMGQRKPAEAARYYERARLVVGDTPQLLAANLAAAIKAGGEVEPLLELARQRAPQAPGILWLAGVWARQQGDLSRAEKYWVQAHAALEHRPEAQGQLAAALADLRRETGLVATSVQVHVRVDESLKGQVSATDVLFVFARAKKGPRLPLAAQRLSAAQLPLEIELNDRMAMVPELKLSSFDAYQVVARISHDGEATPQPGDLFGETEASPSSQVTIVINKVVQ